MLKNMEHFHMHSQVTIFSTTRTWWNIQLGDRISIRGVAML
ncbi:hypothetical protein V6Z11_A04G191000 [Gossypium hirsutum]